MIFSLLFISSLASAQTLEPYKDKLFSNKDRQVIEAKYNSSYIRYKFNEMKDVNGRDTKEKPGIEARPERLEMIPADKQSDIKIDYPGGQLEATEVGAGKDAKFAVIYIHGAGVGADKSQGQNGLSFGGNLNRF